jgi:hypothetical protein
MDKRQNILKQSGHRLHMLAVFFASMREKNDAASAATENILFFDGTAHKPENVMDLTAFAEHAVNRW